MLPAEIRAETQPLQIILPLATAHRSAMRFTVEFLNQNLWKPLRDELQKPYNIQTVRNTS
jgi:hypothetical protein